MIEEKQIMPTAFLEVLKFAHANLHIGLGKHSTATTNGVPQGMSSSPVLFNLYS